LGRAAGSCGDVKRGDPVVRGLSASGDFAIWPSIWNGGAPRFHCS